MGGLLLECQYEPGNQRTNRLDGKAAEIGAGTNLHYAQAEADKLGIGDKVKSTMPTHSFFETAQLRGLVGIYEDGPIDLSTNPEHMEGFGK